MTTIKSEMVCMECGDSHEMILADGDKLVRDKSTGKTYCSLCAVSLVYRIWGEIIKL